MNGDKLFLVDRPSPLIRESSASTAFDITTLSQETDFEFNFDSRPSGAEFNANGSRMYVSGYGNDKVYGVQLDTPFDLTNATQDVSKSVGSTPTGLNFSSGGGLLFVSLFGDTVERYSLSTNYDITTMTQTSTYNTSSQTQGEVIDVTLSPSGGKMFVLSRAQTLYEYNLETDNTFNSVNFVQSTNIPNTGEVSGVTFKPDGSHMYISSKAGEVVEYSLGSNYSLTNKTRQDSISTFSDNLRDISWKVDKSNIDRSGQFDDNLIASDSVEEVIVQYELGTDYDLSTRKEVARWDTPPTPWWADFQGDGQFLIVGRGVGDRGIHRYELSEPYNIESNKTKVGFHDTSVPYAVRFGDGGTRLIWADGNGISQTSLSTPYDLDSSGFDSIGIDDVSDTRGVQFGPNGNTVYTVSFDPEEIRKYSLSTAYDLTTYTFEKQSDLNLGRPYSIEWLDNGHTLLIQDSFNGPSLFYVSTPYDFDTRSLNNSGSRATSSERSLQFTTVPEEPTLRRDVNTKRTSPAFETEFETTQYTSDTTVDVSGLISVEATIVGAGGGGGAGQAGEDADTGIISGGNGGGGGGGGDTDQVTIDLDGIDTLNLLIGSGGGGGTGYFGNLDDGDPGVNGESTFIKDGSGNIIQETQGGGGGEGGTSLNDGGTGGSGASNGNDGDDGEEHEQETGGAGGAGGNSVSVLGGNGGGGGDGGTASTDDSTRKGEDGQSGQGGAVELSSDILTRREVENNRSQTGGRRNIE